MTTYPEPKFKSAVSRFIYAWSIAALTWPIFFVNFTEPNWQKPLFITSLLLFIPGILAVIFPSNKKHYYLPFSWVFGLFIAVLFVVYFGMNIFVQTKI